VLYLKDDDDLKFLSLSLSLSCDDDDDANKFHIFFLILYFTVIDDHALVRRRV
jgi:hypothetical protein